MLEEIIENLMQEDNSHPYLIVMNKGAVIAGVMYTRNTDPWELVSALALVRIAYDPDFLAIVNEGYCFLTDEPMELKQALVITVVRGKKITLIIVPYQDKGDAKTWDEQIVIEEPNGRIAEGIRKCFNTPLIKDRSEMKELRDKIPDSDIHTLGQAFLYLKEEGYEICLS